MFASSSAGFQREFPDPAGGPGAADPAAGQAPLPGPPAAAVASRPLRVAVGGGLCKQRQCYPLFILSLTLTHSDIHVL